MKKQNAQAEIVGRYIAKAILLTYALVSFVVISYDGVAFRLLNLSGTLGIIIIAVNKKVT